MTRSAHFAVAKWALVIRTSYLFDKMNTRWYFHIMYREQEYNRFQEYLAAKRQNIIGDLGHIALSPFTFDLVAPAASENYETKSFNEAPTLNTAYQHELAQLSMKQVIGTPSSRDALQALSKSEFALSA